MFVCVCVLWQSETASIPFVFCCSRNWRLDLYFNQRAEALQRAALTQCAVRSRRPPMHPLCVFEMCADEHDSCKILDLAWLLLKLMYAYMQCIRADPFLSPPPKFNTPCAQLCPRISHFPTGKNNLLIEFQSSCVGERQIILGMLSDWVRAFELLHFLLNAHHRFVDT